MRDSYLDKKLDPMERIKKIWYAVFFLRYWRQWIILHPQYSLENFITYNAYICIELNAHSLIVFIMIIRDRFNADFSLFVPWQLGSQSCEKVFRSARSMSNIFSTIINFSLLGLLRQLHRLQIQSNLQAQSEVTGIAYPQVHKHESKDGTNSFISYSIDSISNTAIGEAVSLAHIAAKASIESLGMDALLNEYEQSSNLPVPDTDTLSDCDADVDSD